MNASALAVLTGNPIISLILAAAALICLALLVRSVTTVIADARATKRAKLIRAARHEVARPDPIFFTRQRGP